MHSVTPINKRFVLAVPAVLGAMLVTSVDGYAQTSTATVPSSGQAGRLRNDGFVRPRPEPRAVENVYAPVPPGTVPNPIGYSMDRSPTFMTSINYPWLYGAYSYGVTPSMYPLSASPSPVISRDETVSGMRRVFVDAPATITVDAPDLAFVWVDDQRLDARGASRSFVTPPLDKNRAYTYKVRARWTAADGRQMEGERALSVRAGDDLRVEFTTPAPAPTSTLRNSR